MTKKNAAASGLAAETKRIIEGVESFGLRIAAQAKLDELIQQSSREAENLAKLVAQRKTFDERDRTTQAANDLLAGMEIDLSDVNETIEASRRRCEVIDAAIRMQRGIISGLEGQVSLDVDAALFEIRKPLVLKIAEALKVLRAAATEEQGIGEALNAARVQLAYKSRVEFLHVSQQYRYDDRWFAEQRAKGYAV